MKITQKSFVLRLVALVFGFAAGTAFGADPVDYSTWMHMKGADWNTRSSYTAANWLYPEGGAAVTAADSTNKRFYADYRLVTPSSASTFAWPLAIAPGVEFAMIGNYAHTTTDLIALDGSVLKKAAPNSHSGSVCVKGKVSYYANPYNANSATTINAAFSGDGDAELDLTATGVDSAGVTINGSWANYLGKLCLESSLPVSLGANFTTLPGALAVGTGVRVSSVKTSGTISLGSLRLEDGCKLTYALASGASSVQYVVSERFEIDGNPVIGIGSTLSTSVDHIDLVKLTGNAALEANLPDVSAIVMDDSFKTGVYPNTHIDIVDGDVTGEKLVRLCWDEKRMTTANSYTSAAGSAFTAGNDSYWTPAGVPDAEVACTARVDAALSVHGYYPARVEYPKLTLCMKDQKFFNNVYWVAFDAVYFDGNCEISGSGHAGSNSSKTLAGDVHINGTLSLVGWGNNENAIFGAIHGQGALKAYVNNTSQGHSVRLEGSGSDFTGCYMIGGDVSPESTKPTRCATVGSGFNFEGVYADEASAWRSIFFTNVWVSISSDMMIDEPTRGVFVDDAVTFEIPANKTLTINDAMTYNARVHKRGAGALVLGNSSTKFAVDGVQQDMPVEGRNGLAIEAGSLKVTNTNAVNGLDVVFAEGTKFVVDPAETDDFRAFGAVNVKAEVPFSTTAASGKITVEFAAIDEAPEKGLELAICTVATKAVADTIAFEVPTRTARRPVTTRWRENADGTYSFVADIAPKQGIVIIVR